MFNVATPRFAIVDQMISMAGEREIVQLAKRRFANSVTRTSEVNEKMCDGRSSIA